MASPTKASCLLLLGTIFASQVSALPTLSIIPRLEPTLSPQAICNQQYYPNNNTLSLRINKTDHAVAAQAFDSTCKSFSDTVNFTANASTTVSTAKGPLVITSFKIAGVENIANTPRSTTNSLGKVPDGPSADDYTPPYRRSDTNTIGKVPDGPSTDFYTPPYRRDQEADDMSPRSTTNTVGQVPDGPSTDFYTTPYRRSNTNTIGKVPDGPSTDDYAPPYRRSTTNTISQVPDGPSTDDYTPPYRRSTTNSIGQVPDGPSTDDYTPPYRRSTTNTIGKVPDGPSTDDYTPPYRRDQEMDDIIGTPIEFTFNGTSYGAILGKPYVCGCSDGGSDGSKDGCPGGEVCCRCVF
ncbi:hypothetical protein MMC10_000353 [Thelotrema lepadinum]|nr:hypothetical protein [Thelotrema lepadinum]